MHTYLQVLLDHGQFQPLDGLRVIRVGLDAFAHDVPCENAHTVLALSIDWFTSLEELLSQVIDLPETGHEDGPRDSQQDAPLPVPTQHIQITSSSHQHPRPSLYLIKSTSSSPISVSQVQSQVALNWNQPFHLLHYLEGIHQSSLIQFHRCFSVVPWN